MLKLSHILQLFLGQLEYNAVDSLDHKTNYLIQITDDETFDIFTQGSLRSFAWNP